MTSGTATPQTLTMQAPSPAQSAPMTRHELKPETT
jgi:hypothetical protein